MTILELEQYAQDEGFDSLEFTFEMNGKESKGKCLDAYFGLFEIGDLEGFVSVSSWRKHHGDEMQFTPIK